MPDKGPERCGRCGDDECPRIWGDVRPMEALKVCNQNRIAGALVSIAEYLLAGVQHYREGGNL